MWCAYAVDEWSHSHDSRCVSRPSVQVRFGRRVRRFRTDGGYSQEAFAHQAGLDRSYLGLIERGQRNITLANIEKIARALGVSISTLMQDV